MQKRIEAMLGGQLFAMAALQEELEKTTIKLEAANARIKELEDKYEPKAEKKADEK